MNELLLCGIIADDVVLSHSNHGHDFMTFPIEVCRLSGTSDVLTVIAPARLCEDLEKGMAVEINGELRSHNDREAVHNRLKVSVWAKSISASEGEMCNSISLDGMLCKPAVYRRTPFGREIADMMLCIPRKYQTPGPRRFDYIPCIAWGSVARMCASLDEHTPIHVEGRLQSRKYMKQIDGELLEKTAYELSVATAQPVVE